MRALGFALLACANVLAHAPIIPPINGPLEVRGNLLVDASTGATVTLRGVSVDEASPVNFGVIRTRWNLNSVRLPVSFEQWRADQDKYVDRVGANVRLANDAGLLVILAAYEVTATGLPSADAPAFWTAFATRFKDNPRVVFSLFREPSLRSSWSAWHAAMQPLADAIRGAGAQQIISVSAFHDAQGFQGLDTGDMLQGSHVIYELHPSFVFGTTDAVRDRLFGSLLTRAPVYAGEWGLDADCAGLPRDASKITDILIQAFNYFDKRSVSWSAAPFRAGGLVTDLTDFYPTTLSGPPTCSGSSGMGEALLLWTTGDPGGFGVLRSDYIGNSAGGVPGTIAPGELATLFTEQLGPQTGVIAQLTSDGKLPRNIGGTEVWVDGVAAPLLYADAYQINFHVPYELQPGSTTLQVFFNGIPSNRLTMDVAASSPELFRDFNTRYVLALNQDGSRNLPSRPAAAGSIVVLYASGGGQTSPPGVAGTPAPSPHPQLNLPVGVTVDGREAEILFAGEVPGNFGLLQVNARLAPLSGSGARPVPIFLRVGDRTSRSPVLLWVGN